MMNSNEQTKIVQINIPDKYHGKLIGKQGSNIKLIRKNLNVKIEFYNQLKEGKNKKLYNVLIASNSEQNCIEAKNRLLEQVNHFITEEEDIETKILVSDENFHKVHAFWDSIRNECEKLNLKLIFLKEKKHFDGRVVDLNNKHANIAGIFKEGLFPKGGLFNVIIKQDTTKNAVNNSSVNHSHRWVAVKIHRRREELKELSKELSAMIAIRNLNRITGGNHTGCDHAYRLQSCCCNWTYEQRCDYETYYH